jgi:hypothetical protein
MPRYFTGRTVESRRLTQAQASTFQALVTDLIDQVAMVSVTREQYFELSSKERSAAKNTSYIVAATFDGTNGERLMEHARPCNLIFLDIDTLPNGSSPAEPFVERPALLRERLKWNFAAYKTISSTEAAPRLRVMVDASDIPVDRYPDAVLTVAAAMGLANVTRESAVAVQPMFRPSVFQGQDIEKDHPLICTQFDGETFTVDDICEDLASLPGMVSAGRVARISVKGDAAEDYLTYFRLPVPQVTLQVARDILAILDPDCSRKEWIDVAAGLRHQFPDNPQEAYDLFLEWSMRGTKFVGPGDAEVNWRSLTTQPRGRVPVTIRTVLKMGVEQGWDGAAKVRESCFQDLTSWIMFKCESLTQLTNEGIKRIAAAPLMSSTEEGMLLRTLMAQLTQKYEQKIGLTELKKDLQKAKDEIFLKKENPVDMETLPWARGIVFVASTNEFFRPATHQKFDIQAFDAVNSRYLLPNPEDLKKKDQAVNQGTLYTPMFKPSLYVLNHARCKTVDDYDYDPSQPEEIVIHRDGKSFVNTYRRSYPAADKRLAAYAEDVFLDHLCNLVAEPELRTVILDWMAWQVQHPGEKVRWAILLQGGQGNGKTAISEVMCAVLGDANVRSINSNTIKKGWSEWGVGSQLVFMEEIRVLGKERHDVANSLKEPITNRRITINKRGEHTETLRNVTNYMAFTNYHNAIPLEEGDRRWCVIKSALQNREQVAALLARDPQYFVRLHDICETHAAGLRFMLEDRTITSRFNPNGPAPHTSYKDEMMHDTANELSTVVRQIIDDGENPYITDKVVALKSMIAAMAAAGVSDVSQYAASTLLRELGYSEAGRHLIGADKQPVWVRKDLLGGTNVVALLGSIGKDATLIDEDDFFT